MKAAIYNGPGPLILSEAMTPTAGPNEVIVKVKTCGICHTDVNMVKGTYFPRKKPPLIMGHELAGIIAEMGSGLEHANINVGDRVLVIQVISCQTCPRCLEGRHNLCQEAKTLGIDVNGGYADYVCVSARNILKLPDSISFGEGSIIADALSTAFHSVSKLHLKQGETVAIYGSGVLGLNAVQTASKIFGAKVIAIDTEEWKLNLALAKGAWKTIKAQTNKNTVSILQELTGKVDAAMEFIGTPSTYEQAISSVRSGGRVVLTGAATQPFSISPFRIFKEEINITGSYASVPEEIPYLINLVDTGQLSIRDMITHVFSFSELNAAIDMLAGHRQKSLRAVIEM